MDDTPIFLIWSISTARHPNRRRASCDLKTASRHNFREIQAEMGAHSRIAAKRTAYNINLLPSGPSSADSVVELAHRLLRESGIDPSQQRKNVAQAIEALFGLPADTALDTRDYFTRCLDWVRGKMRLPVLSAWIHNDEDHPHLHVLMLPLKDGAHLGSKPIGRAELPKLRESFFNEVAGPAGLRRPKAKLRGPMREWGVRAALAQCESMGLPAANGVMWPVLADAIKRDPLPALDALQIPIERIRPTSDDGDMKPIGFQERRPEKQNLCSVGFALPSYPTRATEATLPPAATLAELWERVGCKVQVTRARQAERLETANVAVAAAVARQAARDARRPLAVPLLVVRDDGRTVDRRDAEPCPW